MSRTGRKPVRIPEGVIMKLEGTLLTAESAGKKLEYEIPDGITLDISEGVIDVKRDSDSKRNRALHGLSRTLIANMAVGVKDGFTKKLEMVGRGKRARVEGRKLILEIGLSHPIEFDLPEGIEARVEKQIIEISGYDKQKVGEIAAELRDLQPPEPYKGSGIRYQDEYVKKKAGKSAVGGGFTGSGK